MAVTLTEQRLAFEDGPLRNKVAQAMCVSANVPLNGEAVGFASHANRAILARQILFGTSDVFVDAFLRAAIAANAGAANLAAVTGASDAAVQSAIGAAFDNFANGQ